MANQYKFVGTDNSTSGSAINPFGKAILLLKPMLLNLY